MKTHVQPGDTVSGNHYVVAILEKGVLLSDARVVSAPDDLEVETVGAKHFFVDPECKDILAAQGMLAPKITDLHLGDGLISFEDHYAKLILIAVLQRETQSAFDVDGNFIPMGNNKIARTGWRTSNTDILTDTGRRVLGSFYS